jgi:hypothetical protein
MMKKVLTALVSGALFLSGGIVIADSHKDAADQPDPASPVEIFACSYNDGKGPADLDAAVDKWNAWADKQGLDDYSAWTLVPYYAGPEQEFDVIWLGAAPSAKALGRAQDTWLATGGKVQEAFNDASTCNAHANFAALQFKAPPKRENPSNIVISFSDCNMADGLSFDDVAPALGEWADYRKGHGSTSGIWAFFPAYGGGSEEFDFKYIAAWQNLEDQGADWDQYSAGGYAKAGELFAGKLDCDSSRVYLATNRRMAKDDDE